MRRIAVSWLGDLILLRPRSDIRKPKARTARAESWAHFGRSPKMPEALSAIATPKTNAGR